MLTALATFSLIGLVAPPAKAERGGSESPNAQLEAVIDGVSDPRFWSSGGQIISDLLIADAAGAMYAPEVWPEYADFLDGIADAAVADQPAPALVTQRIRLLGRLSPARQEADYPNGRDAF